MTKVTKTVVAAAVALAGFAFATGLPAVAGGDAAAGKTLFTGKCAGCHGATAAKNFKLKAPTDAQWTKIIKEGKKPMMPAFKSLSDADIANIVAYLRTIKK